MVGNTLGVYIFGLIFVSARTNKRHLIIMCRQYTISSTFLSVAKLGTGHLVESKRVNGT
jgi:hypothetical protein